MKRRVHLAIMRKSWGLLEKIITGEKTIESRWYLKRSSPWGKIFPKDIIYFKNSGESVKVVAMCKKVVLFSNLNSRRVKELLKRYGKKDGIDEKDIKIYYQMFKNKKYCLFIFLEKAEKLKNPFMVDKSGFGIQSAWLVFESFSDFEKRKRQVI